MTANPRGGEAAQAVQKDGSGVAPANLRSGRGAPNVECPVCRAAPGRDCVFPSPQIHLQRVAAGWRAMADNHTYPDSTDG